MLKAKELKALVNQFSDDAEIVGSGIPGLYITLVVLDYENTIIKIIHLSHTDDYRFDFFSCEPASYTDLIFNPKKHNRRNGDKK